MSYDFRQKTFGRFTVHIYNVGMNPKEYFYDNAVLAIQFAKNCFKNNDNCYKVKVWDSELGPIEPNRVDPPGLILHLV